MQERIRDTMAFGDRLYEIRSINGMTQEELAKRISLEKMSISKYESGKMLPSSSTLVALCNVFDVGADYFFRESKVHISAVPQFRTDKNKKLAKSVQTQICMQTECAVGNLLEISEICSYSRDSSSLESMRRSVWNNEDIEKLALEVRNVWNLGLDPIENLMEVCEVHGFTIILVDGPKEFDAAVFIDERYGPVIALRRGAQKERQRFTLAHELGHFFIRDDGTSSPKWNPETRANRFAAALLVPRDVLLNDVGHKRAVLSADELCMLHEKYGVSVSALLNRMASVGIISDALRAKWAAFDRAGNIDKRCVGSSMGEEPRLVRKLVFRAVAEGYISERKGAELLKCGFFGSSLLGADA